jgi:hypothetical protein
VLLSTRYSEAAPPVKLPSTELVVDDSDRAVGWSAGAVQVGSPATVVTSPERGAAVKYFGPPAQELLTAKTKKL